MRNTINSGEDVINYRVLCKHCNSYIINGCCGTATTNSFNSNFRNRFSLNKRI